MYLNYIIKLHIFLTKNINIKVIWLIGSKFKEEMEDWPKMKIISLNVE